LLSPPQILTGSGTLALETVLFHYERNLRFKYLTARKCVNFFLRREAKLIEKHEFKKSHCSPAEDGYSG
jgi:hypothetical protein